MWPKLSSWCAIGTSPLTYGLRNGAGRIWVNPTYEMPNVPIVPSHHGCWPTHCWVS